MKLVTFKTSDNLTHAGVLRDNQVVALPYPTLLEVLCDADAINRVRQYVGNELLGGREVLIDNWGPHVFALDEVALLAPISNPPTLRDFYAFEQHVKTSRARHGFGMLPEWYEIPTFYFSNTSEISGPDATVSYPLGCQELDFELEIACV